MPRFMLLQRECFPQIEINKVNCYLNLITTESHPEQRVVAQGHSSQTLLRLQLFVSRPIEQGRADGP